MATDQERAPNILIVDDEADIRETLGDILEEEGYGVLRAANGREALDHLQQTPAVCLILLDLLMPIMDGWEFRNRQKQEPELATVPVVVISGTGDLARKAASIGAVDYLDKPVAFDALFRLTSRHCPKGRASRQKA